MAGKARKFAQVGEWLKPTDCKSVPPSEVRRFESFPVHHDSRESLVHCAGLLRGAVSADLGYDYRHEDSGRNAGYPGAVRSEVGVAPQRRAAPGQGKRAGVTGFAVAES